MPKAKTPLISLDAQGSIGRTITYRQHRPRRPETTDVISHPTHPDPATPAQLLHRFTFQSCAATWNALTPAQKAEYSQRRYPPNLTGYNRFMAECLRIPAITCVPHVDDFNDNDIDLAYWIPYVRNPTSWVNEVNQRIEVSTDNPRNVTCTAGLITLDPYEMDEGISFQIEHDLNTLQRQHLGLSLEYDPLASLPPSTNKIYIRKEDIANEFRVYQVIDGWLSGLYAGPGAVPAATLGIAFEPDSTIKFYEDGVLQFQCPNPLPTTTLYPYFTGRNNTRRDMMAFFDNYELRCTDDYPWS